MYMLAVEQWYCIIYVSYFICVLKRKKQEIKKKNEIKEERRMSNSNSGKIYRKCKKKKNY